MKRDTARTNLAGPLRLGIYVRYSTQEQRENSYSREMQVDECLAKFRRVHGDTPFVLREFSDLGMTGAAGVLDPANPQAEYRQGLTDLLRCVVAGELDMVLCYAQDRLARDELVWHSMRALAFEKTGTPVLFAREDHDILTPEGRVISSVHAMMAAEERRKISSNVAAACRRRAAEGYQAGFPPYGWQYDPDQVPAPRERRRMVRNEAEGAILLEIRERYLAGWLTVEICRDLHRRGVASPSGRLAWTTSGLLKVLRNPVHAGLVVYRGERFPGAHAALRYWTPEEHEYLEQRIAERADRVTHSRRIAGYLLSSALYCEHCGRRMVGGRDVRGRRHYACNAPKTEGRHTSRMATHRGRPFTCPGVRVDADDLEEALRKAVSELARSEAVQSAAGEKLRQSLDAADSRLTAELAGIERDLEQLASGFSKLFALLDNGVITDAEFRVENAKRREQEEALTRRKADLETKMRLRRSRQQQLERAFAILKDFDAMWEAMTQAERRELLLEIDPHMTVRRDEGFTVVTVRPAFAEPIELPFLRRPPKPVRECGPDAPLSERQLALLALWGDGLSVKQIARQFDISTAAVNSCAKGILKRLSVQTVEEAVELKRDTIAACRHTLPLHGRLQKRNRNSPDILTPPMLEVVRLLAEGKRATDAAAILGKDKSTISRQIKAAQSRLAADTIQETIARARELGLVPDGPDLPDDHYLAKERPLIPLHLQRVLELDRAGRSVEEIAAELDIKVSSANVYRKTARKRARELGI